MIPVYYALSSAFDEEHFEKVFSDLEPMMNGLHVRIFAAIKRQPSFHAKQELAKTIHEYLQTHGADADLNKLVRYSL